MGFLAVFQWKKKYCYTLCRKHNNNHIFSATSALNNENSYDLALRVKFNTQFCIGWESSSFHGIEKRRKKLTNFSTHMSNRFFAKSSSLKWMIKIRDKWKSKSSIEYFGLQWLNLSLMWTKHATTTKKKRKVSNLEKIQFQSIEIEIMNMPIIVLYFINFYKTSALALLWKSLWNFAIVMHLYGEFTKKNRFEPHKSNSMNCWNCIISSINLKAFICLFVQASQTRLTSVNFQNFFFFFWWTMSWKFIVCNRILSLATNLAFQSHRDLGFEQTWRKWNL